MKPLAACLDVLACKNMVGILLLHLHNHLYNIEQDLNPLKLGTLQLSFSSSGRGSKFSFLRLAS